jgi:hypothetical protein
MISGGSLKIYSGECHFWGFRLSIVCRGLSVIGCGLAIMSNKRNLGFNNYLKKSHKLKEQTQNKFVLINLIYGKKKITLLNQ